ncbi:DUF1212-domain-containing protein [Rhizoclosmatium globosum]|uniref:DUF1212-domain-containing protein n=1 Tax=Rhizoclosmatium globosum TaxID=329046 RepID=A0A1Y2BUF0_9FUNG|nr:DUF1212-domain-containing protein [Rhizoclosmatium globosum]|eukprot:ORY38392.1 DUF1212-domain-containing protein [Rhizoclosmatium globosum]
MGKGRHHQQPSPPPDHDELSDASTRSNESSSASGDTPSPEIVSFPIEDSLTGSLTQKPVPPSHIGQTTPQKKSVLDKFKLSQRSRRPSSSATSKARQLSPGADPAATATAHAAETPRGSESDSIGLSSDDDESSGGFTFSAAAKVPLSSVEKEHVHFHSSTTTATSENHDSGVIKRTLSESTLTLQPGMPQPPKRAYIFRDPREWLAGFGTTAPAEPTSSDIPLQRTNSTPLFVPSKAETHLEETAEVLGVQRTEDVDKLLKEEGISTWATVLAVGSGVSGNGTPMILDEQEDGSKEDATSKNADEDFYSEDVSEGAGKRKPSNRLSKLGPLMRRKRTKPSLGKRSSTGSTQSKDEDEAVKRDFIIKIARALTAYGAPSHRLEYHLAAIAKVLKVEAEFIIFPGVVFSNFGGESHKSNTHFARQNQGINMGKLAQVNALCLTLTQNLINVYNAIDLLEGVRSGKDYPWWVMVLIFPVSSFTIALLLFQATWIESMFALFLGLIVGLLNMAAEKYQNLNYLLEFLSAFISAFLSKAVQGSIHDSGQCFRYLKVTLSAVALFLPGLPLTIAIIDLSSRNAVSGTVRLFSSLFTAMLLGFGMTIGSALVLWSSDNSDGQNCQPTSQWWSILFFVPMSMSLNLLFQANKHQWPIMILSALVGFLMSVFLNMIPQLAAQPTVTTALCAVGIGLTSNLYARITNDVAIAPILAGILLQVPGSLSVKSTLGFFGGISGSNSAGSVVDGISFTFEMLTIAMSLALGLFLSNLIVFPLRGPNSKYQTV